MFLTFPTSIVKSIDKLALPNIQNASLSVRGSGQMNNAIATEIKRHFKNHSQAVLDSVLGKTSSSVNERSETSRLCSIGILNAIDCIFSNKTIV